jgi:hypothetical protein
MVAKSYGASVYVVCVVCTPSAQLRIARENGTSAGYISPPLARTRDLGDGRQCVLYSVICMDRGGFPRLQTALLSGMAASRAMIP